MKKLFELPPFVQALGIALLILGGAYLLFGRGPVAEESKRLFSTSISDFPEAKASETIELKNGDTFNLAASVVKKKIGSETLKMLAYNGSIPGPLIKIPQGAEIAINFTNNTDVETTVHSHGVRLENKFDGVPEILQEPIKPGQSFVYKIKFPDAGIYWYHPHLREDYAQELGLYGNFLVVPGSDGYWSPVNREVTLFLDDILVENGAAQFYTALTDRALMGRFGNTMLVNGEIDYKLDAKRGEVIRFYITNSANTRVFNVAIPGAKMKLVGSDGGKYEKETWAESVIISPSERATVEVFFENAGTYPLQHKTPNKTYALGNISVSDEGVSRSYAREFSNLKTNSDVREGIDPFRAYFTKTPDKRISLDVDMGTMMNNTMSNMMSSPAEHGAGHGMSNNQMVGGDGEKIEWEEDGMNGAMNKESTNKMITWKIVDQDTRKENEDIQWRFKVGDKVKIKIFNDPNSMHPMQHPIHIHGQRFLVVSVNGQAQGNLVWKDTVLVEKGDSVELLVDMSNPGTWMIHCHIPEHLESGMDMSFEVI